MTNLSGNVYDHFNAPRSTRIITRMGNGTWFSSIVARTFFFFKKKKKQRSRISSEQL